MTIPTRYERLPREQRLRVVALLDAGKQPLEVSRELKVPLPLVVRAARKQLRGIVNELLRRLQKRLVAKSTHQHASPPVSLRGGRPHHLPGVVLVSTRARAKRADRFRCIVLRFASGPCMNCKSYVAENPHAWGDGTSQTRIYCAACCPEHGAALKRGKE